MKGSSNEKRRNKHRALEIITAILFAGNVVYYDALASEIVSSETEIKGVLEPGVCKALERLAKRKGFHGSFQWYWRDEDECRCSADNVRRYYYVIDMLPSKDNISTLPSVDYINQQCKEGTAYRQYLINLRDFAPPWDIERIDALIEEGEAITAFWNAAWACRNYEKDGLHGRLALQKLQDMLGGSLVDTIWGIPSFPTWRVKRDTR